MKLLAPRLSFVAIAVAATAAAALAGPATAGAAIPKAFDDALTCTVNTGATAGERTCSGIVNVPDRQSPSVAGTVPIDVNLFLPPAPASGPDGDFPVVGTFHGWGGSKAGRDGRWLDRGYAQFSISDRGWGSSCGGLDSKRLNPASGCQHGYNHLLDTRFEVHDVQYLLGLLADDGIIDPGAIGVTGGSYGGGMSMALAALKNRTMPADYEAGGTLEPWQSPGGIPMSIAAAAPDIPWTDLPYSLQPNGRTLDYVAYAPYLGPGGDAPVGVMKQSFVSGLYATGAAFSNYAPPGADLDADLHTWYSGVSAGEPYDGNPLSADIVEELSTHHSSYYIDNSVKPAPLHISNGTTDDLFPPDEAIRFYNKTLADHPSANIYLYFSDHGHQRGQNKGADTAKRNASVDKWFAHFLKGEGLEPPNGVSLLAQECGGASQGPFSAPSWAELPNSEIVFDGGSAAQVILPDAGDPARGRAYDPIAGGGACATADGSDQPGVASFRLPPAPPGGYTLTGSPTISADILSPGPHSQIAARLLDVDASGNATLVARGLYRPGLVAPAAERQVFQLHPNGYLFEEGHVAKLELLPNDAPYGRVTNGQSAITVTKLELRLPINEQPGTAGSVAPLPKFVPDGYELARDYAGEPVDSDGDGIADPDDDCPSEPGPPSQEAGKNGCPLPPVDTDEDGVPDENDACPEDPGPAENGGCPLVTAPDAPTLTGTDPASPADDNDPEVQGTAASTGEPADDVLLYTSADCSGDPVASGTVSELEGAGITIHVEDNTTTEISARSRNAGGTSECSNPITYEEATGGSVCTVEGTPGNDLLVGTPGPDRICGYGGNDVIKGLGGDDVLEGGPGNDVLVGGSGADSLDGGDGTDTAAYNGGAAQTTGPVAADLGSGFAGDDGSGSTDTFVGGSVENLRGSSFDDVLSGDGGPNRIDAEAGDDAVSGGAGNDRLFGRSGDDLLSGGGDNDLLKGEGGGDRLFGDAGNDRLFPGLGDDTDVDGGAGIDQLRYNDLAGPIELDLAAGTVTGAGTDTVAGASFRRVYGTAGDDTLSAGFPEPGDDVITILIGLAGSDTFDTVDGRGHDIVNAKAGQQGGDVDVCHVDTGTARDKRGDGCESLNPG